MKSKFYIISGEAGEWIKNTEETKRKMSEARRKKVEESRE